MFFKEAIRKNNNQKILNFSKSILEKCVMEEFTISDMKDLARIFPELIDEAIMFDEEKQGFMNFGDVPRSLGNSADILKQNPRSYQNTKELFDHV